MSDYGTRNGYNSEALGDNATAIGYSAAASAKDSTSLGARAKASSPSSTAVGSDAECSGAKSTAVGAGAKAGANQVVLGTSSELVITPGRKRVHGNTQLLSNLTVGNNAHVSNELSTGSTVYVGGNLLLAGAIGALPAPISVANVNSDVDLDEVSTNSSGSVTIAGNIVVEGGATMSGSVSASGGISGGSLSTGGSISGNSAEVGSLAVGGAVTTNELTVSENALIEGDLNVSGTKNFDIPHPHPAKRETHRLRHAAVESPTEGDNLYRYAVSALENNQTIEINLPDYFNYLNKNVMIWVAAADHFGRGYGKLVGDTLEVVCEHAGMYNVLIVGTRKDDNVQGWADKGVEKLVNEKW